MVACRPNPGSSGKARPHFPLVDSSFGNVFSRQALRLTGFPGQFPQTPLSGNLRAAPSPRLHCVYGTDILGAVAERKDPLDSCTGFEWDEANAHKNWERHRVTPGEAEDVFFNEPLVVRSDVRHSKQEKRYYALGQTGGGRYLFVAFTIRRSLLRIISVRDMNRKEMDAYANHEKEARA